jgi:hypothetical protein
VQLPPGTQLALLGRIMRTQSESTGPTVDPDTRRGTVVPTIAVLDTWANFAWSDGCQVDALQAFQPLTIVTRNHAYEMVVLDGATGLVRVRGGQFFPEWRQVFLAGCSLGGSFLKLRGIYAGFGMELHAEGEVVITSPVQRLTLSHFALTCTH